jgi:hypothetical protein
MDTIDTDESIKPKRNHAAGGPLLGFLYQVRYALVYLLDADEGFTHSIRLEGLDDLESLNADKLCQLGQVKHHQNPQAYLSERSVDLWRTIRIWSELVQSIPIRQRNITLCFYTTSSVKDGSALEGLTARSRRKVSYEKVQEVLCQIAQTPNKSISRYV